MIRPARILFGRLGSAGEYGLGSSPGVRHPTVGSGGDSDLPRCLQAGLAASFLHGRLGRLRHGQGFIILERIPHGRAAARRAAAGATDAGTAGARADAGDTAAMSAARAAGKQAVQRAADFANRIGNDAQQRPATRVAASRGARAAAIAPAALVMTGRLILGPRSVGSRPNHRARPRAATAGGLPPGKCRQAGENDSKCDEMALHPKTP